MTDMKDKKKRHELIRRYLEAETTIEEERLLLEYFMHTEDELTPEEEEVRLIVLSTTCHIEIGRLNDEKEAEFDKMMEGKTVAWKSHRIPSKISWSFSVAAALVLALCLTTKETMKDAPATHQYAKTATTTPHPTLPTPLEEQPQQKEREADFQMAKAENGDTTKKSMTLVDDKDMQETNMSIREDNKQVATVIEPSETEKTNTSLAFTTTTVDDSEDKRYPLHVTTANYCREHKGSNHLVPSGDITFATKTTSNSNATQHVVANSGNGLRTLLSETPDDSVIYVVDGKRVSKEAANRISPDCIKEKRRLKRGTADAIKETPEGLTRDIIVITTKKSDTYGEEHLLAPHRNTPLASDDDTRKGICLL